MSQLVKAVVPSRARGWLSQGLGWAAGYVVREVDLPQTKTPAALHAALGLGFPGSPFDADADSLDVIRIPASGQLVLDPVGASETVPPFVDHSPLSGTGFVESAESMIPYWWLAPSALPAGSTIWRIHADGREEMIAAYAHVAMGWIAAIPGTALPSVGLRSPDMVGIWAESGGERMLADVLPDGRLILCSAEEREGMQRSERGVWWRTAERAEVDHVYGVRVLATWQGRPVQLVGAERGESGDLFHVVYLGHDALDAESLGLTKSDAGVYEGVVPPSQVRDIGEERRELPLG